MFHDQRFDTGLSYYLSQYKGLLWKTVLVRYRRWALTLIILLLPILYNIISHVISRSRNETGIFRMEVNALNPQTILYHTDESLEEYFRASTSGAKLEQVANSSEMNDNIWRKYAQDLSA